MADSKAGALKIYDDLRHLVVSGNKVLRREKKRKRVSPRDTGVNLQELEWPELE